MAQVNPEKQLYDKIYTDEAYTQYGHTNHGDRWMVDILELEPTSWLDVGCGHNALIENVRIYLDDAWGVDFACPTADQNCDMLDLPFADNRWDFVTAFDVMEHLLPEQVTIGLSEMARVARRFAFSISYTEALTVIDGKNVHPTVWSADKWTTTIEEFGIIDNMSVIDEGFFIGTWKENDA